MRTALSSLPGGANLCGYDGNKAHCAIEDSNSRWSLVFYLRRGTEKLSSEDRKYLESLGFVLPENEAAASDFATRLGKEIASKPGGTWCRLQR